MQINGKIFFNTIINATNQPKIDQASNKLLFSIHYLFNAKVVTLEKKTDDLPLPGYFKDYRVEKLAPGKTILAVLLLPLSGLGVVLKLTTYLSKQTRENHSTIKQEKILNYTCPVFLFAEPLKLTSSQAIEEKLNTLATELRTPSTQPDSLGLQRRVCKELIIYSDVLIGKDELENVAQHIQSIDPEKIIFVGAFSGAPENAEALQEQLALKGNSAAKWSTAPSPLAFPLECEKDEDNVMKDKNDPLKEAQKYSLPKGIKRVVCYAGYSNALEQKANDAFPKLSPEDQKIYRGDSDSETSDSETSDSETSGSERSGSERSGSETSGSKTGSSSTEGSADSRNSSEAEEREEEDGVESDQDSA